MLSLRTSDVCWPAAQLQQTLDSTLRSEAYGQMAISSLKHANMSPGSWSYTSAVCHYHIERVSLTSDQTPGGNNSCAVKQCCVISLGEVFRTVQVTFPMLITCQDQHLTIVSTMVSINLNE